MVDKIYENVNGRAVWPSEKLLGPKAVCNMLSWEENCKRDVWDVDNRTLWLGPDIKILFLTVKKVLVHDGISADGQATMERFRGNDR